jgi:hypothetical protein
MAAWLVLAERPRATRTIRRRRSAA